MHGASQRLLVYWNNMLGYVSLQLVDTIVLIRTVVGITFQSKFIYYI